MKAIAARNLAAAGLPDPMCKTGVVSLKLGENPQSCCAGYCGECSDYKTCESVRGQNSKNACCATAVYEQRCGKAAANVCLKKCSEAVPRWPTQAKNAVAAGEKLAGEYKAPAK